MKEILKRIKPKKEEIVEFQKITEEFLKKLNKKSKLLLYTSLDDLKKAQVIFEKHLNIANCPQVRRMRN